MKQKVKVSITPIIIRWTCSNCQMTWTEKRYNMPSRCFPLHCDECRGFFEGEWPERKK